MSDGAIARALAELKTERDNLAARLEKVEGLITTMCDVFHLPMNGAKPLKRAAANGNGGNGNGSNGHGSNGHETPATDAILAALKHGPLSPGALAKAVGMERTDLRQHLKALERAGTIVATGVTASRRIALPSARSSTAKEAP